MKSPYLCTEETAKLIVKGKPFIAFAGEVHNSSCSNVEYFKKNVLEKIEEIPLNTLILPIYWEMIEKEEGIYNFEEVKKIISAVRERNLHIIFLWFGLWKNGLSTYIPTWMKNDREKYPFIKDSEGKRIYTVTPLCKEAVEKDAKAFSKVMNFIKEFDEEEQTVIMIQTENEIGVLGAERDFGDVAEDRFSNDIPYELSKWSNKSGTWEEVFKEEANEIFMAYHYAKAIEEIASKGNEIYNIPMMINVWIKKDGEKPGKYPSGGAIIDRIDIFKQFAPSIDVIAPDIYVKYFEEVCDQYSEQGILAIPESRQDKASMSNIIYGISKYPLICYAPFGIEDFTDDNRKDKLNDFLLTLGITKGAFNPDGAKEYLCEIYKDLQSMQDLILRYRGSKDIYSFYNRRESVSKFNIGNINVTASSLKKEKEELNSTGFIIDTGNEFYIYGTRFMLQFSHKSSQVGILELEEGTFHNGKWCVESVLNGDERYNIYALDNPRLFRVVLHTY